MVAWQPKEELLSSKEAYLARLDTAMGGRVAEELVFGAEKVTPGKATVARLFFTVKVPKDGRVKPASFFSSLTIASIRSPAALVAATPVQPVLF